jgi:precorrin-3B synthase
MPTGPEILSAPIRSIRAVPTQPAPPARAPGSPPVDDPGSPQSGAPGSAPVRALGEVDACPGALRLHAAADGPLARIRVPGGLLTGAQLKAVHELAETWGDGHVELTSRANLQLRGLTTAPADALAARLWAAGLLPSQTHELVRNIAASPLPGVLDVLPLVAELDRELCSDPRLAELPGRFLFALDSGHGDVAGSADVAAVPAPGPGADEIAILFAGVDAGLRVARTGVVAALLAAANAFLDERAAQASSAHTPTTQNPTDDLAAGGAGAAWRLRELVDGPLRVAQRTAALLGFRLGEPDQTPTPDLAAPDQTPTPEKRDPIGIVAQPDGLFAVAALVPLGRLSGVQLTVLARAERLVVTPWRGVVVPDLTRSAAQSWLRALADADLEVATGSRWVGVTTCAGRPGCAKALADVRRDATTTVRAAPGGRGLPVHWVGCGRGCGSPGGAHVRVEATEMGYAVTAPGFSAAASAAGVGELVTAARRN